MYTNEDTATKVRVGRAQHFGERSLLRGDSAAQVNIDAGSEGMVCLTFEGEVIKQLQNELSLKSEKGSSPPGSPASDGTPMRRASKQLLPDFTKSVAAWIQDKGESYFGRAVTEGELKLEDLTKVGRLGTGGFADVFLAFDKKNRKHYALKRMSMGFVQSLGENATNMIVWERDLLYKVDSPFIVKLFSTFKDSEYIYFLMESLLGGDLLSVLHERSEIFTVLNDKPRGYSAAFYAGCAIAALEHLHQRCIVHRDVKPENVLIDQKGYAKICDMGFARYVLGETNTMCGTPEYMPPEQIDFPHKHSQSADWWSLGVLTFEMLTGHTPFDDEGLVGNRERLLAVRRSQEKLQVIFPFGVPALAKTFILKLLKKLPHRLGADGDAPEVRKDDFFRLMQFDFDALHRQALEPPFVPARSKKLDLRREIPPVRRRSIFKHYQESRARDSESDSTRCFSR